MPLVSFSNLLRDAQDGGYAIGYFESWDLASVKPSSMPPKKRIPL